MKKLLFSGLTVVLLASSYATIAVKSNPVKSFKTEIANIKKVGPDCKVQYERKCNFGNPLVILPGQIISPIDADNYCRQTSISCSVTECSARLSVLFGILPGSPKSDSCLPAGFRGK